MNLTHVRLLTRDFRAAFLFYRDILGLPTRFQDDAGPYAEFDLGGDRYLGLFDAALMGSALGITPDGAAAAQRGADSAVLVFEVEDPDAEADRLASLGVGIVAAPADRAEWGLRTVHVRDPDGNLIELFRGLEDS